MLAGSLRSRGIIRQALRQRLVFAGIRQPRIFQKIISRISAACRSLFSVAAAKLSVSARHAKRAWLEPCTTNVFCRFLPLAWACTRSSYTNFFIYSNLNYINASGEGPSRKIGYLGG